MNEIYNNPKFVEKYYKQIKDINNKNYYERFYIRSLLSDVKNKKVLDAGCGPGIYTNWLLENNSFVTALDFSSEMLKIVQKNAINKNNLKIIETDLNKKIPIDDNYFDIILCTMVLLHIKNWDNIFSEFNRILKKSGKFIFMTVHPFADINEDSNYFEIENTEEEWTDFNIKLYGYRRSFENIFKIIKNNGFIISELIEPKPLKNSYLSNLPWFIIFSLEKK